MQVAILGGSFDPPHNAHVQIISYLLGQPGVDEVWVLPAGKHPFKQATASFEDRLQMSRLAFEPLGPAVKVLSDDERLTGYTIDLIRHLKEKYRNHEFTFWGGSDLQKEIEGWKDSDELQKSIHFKFFPRAPESPSPFDPISSTDIREKVKNQLPFESLVPKPVAVYIRKNKLYENPSGLGGLQ